MSVKREKAIKRRRRVIIAIVLAAVILVGIIVGVVALLRSSVTGGASQQIPEEYRSPNYLSGDSMNILVLGIDNEEGREHAFADVIMIVSYDKKAGTVNVLRIPRDTYAGEDVRGWKINAGYSNDGEADIIKYIGILNEKLGVPIDHYMTITMDGFKQAIDIMGGIDIELDEELVLSPDYTLNAGVNHLDGYLADFFVRFRGYNNGDFGRMAAQQKFMAALMSKIKTMSMSEAVALVRQLYEYLETDFTAAEVISLMKDVRGMSMEQVAIHVAPGTDAWVMTPFYDFELYYYSIDKAGLLEIVNQYMRPYMDPITAEDMGITPAPEE